MWHNGDTYAAVISVLKALSAEVDVCRSLIAAPGGLERLIAVMSTTFGTVEEGALLLTSICERGSQAHLPFDELTKAGLLEKMKEIAVILATTPRPQRRVAMKRGGCVDVPARRAVSSAVPSPAALRPPHRRPIPCRRGVTR